MIYYVRHGSTDWNEHKNSQGQRDPRCQGRVDLELNSVGISQALATAEALKDKKFDRVICSPLKRAKQTCKIIYHGARPVEIDNRIIERDFGEFEGMSRTEFDFKGFWNANTNTQYKNAESIEDVKARVFDLLDELKQNPNQDVLIVSHGGVGCVLMSYFRGVPLDGNYLSFEVPNGKPLVLDFNNINQTDNTHNLT